MTVVLGIALVALGIGGTLLFQKYILGTFKKVETAVGAVVSGVSAAKKDL